MEVRVGTALLDGREISCQPLRGLLRLQGVRGRKLCGGDLRRGRHDALDPASASHRSGVLVVASMIAPAATGNSHGEDDVDLESHPGSCDFSKLTEATRVHSRFERIGAWIRQLHDMFVDIGGTPLRGEVDVSWSSWPFNLRPTSRPEWWRQISTFSVSTPRPTSISRVSRSAQPTSGTDGE